MNTRKIYHNLDLRFNELLNAKLATLGNDAPVGTIGRSGAGKIALMTTDGISEYIDSSALALAVIDLERQITDANDAAETALNRANHTGTQPAETISNFLTAAQAAAKLISLDQFATAAADVNFGGKAITGVAMPVGVAANAADAATRGYVDAAVAAGTSSGADRLTTARNFSITGVVTAGAVSFDGTSAVVLNTAIANGALTIAKTSGLQAALDGKSDTGHKHSAADITSGTLPIARGGTGATTAAAARTALGAAPEAHTHVIANVTGLQNELDGKISTTARGAANGVAPLDSAGLIPTTYLPSYVDDVLEVENAAGLPAVGEKGKIYVTTNNGYIFRWSGSAYVRINDAVSVAEEALQLAEAQNFSITGVVTAGAVSFDGTGAVVLNTAIADGALSIAKTNGLQSALAAKFDKAGGVLTGVASYATGVAPVAAQDLTTKAYVDQAAAAVAPVGTNAITVSQNKEIDLRLAGNSFLKVDGNGVAVDVVGLNNRNRLSRTTAASTEGVVTYTENLSSWLAAVGLTATPHAARVDVYSAGVPVEMAISWNGTSLTVAGQGAEAAESFNIVVRA